MCVCVCVCVCICNCVYAIVCMQCVYAPAQFLNKVLSASSDFLWEVHNINTLKDDVICTHWISTRERRTK